MRAPRAAAWGPRLGRLWARAVATGVTLALGAVPLLAQTGFSMDSSGNLIRNGYGTQGLNDSAKVAADSALGTSLSEAITMICDPLQALLILAGAAAILRGFLELVRAAKGTGSWGKGVALFIMGWFCVVPANFLRLFGVTWLLPSDAGWACLY